MAASPASRARRLALPLAVVAAALAARLWRLGSAGLDHFDEGVYALSARALAGSADTLYPDQVLFSPPVYLTLVGLLQRLSGAALDLVMIGLNVLLGALTVALVGMLGARWFGRAAGWSGAAMLALCEYHVGLSRTGLTDVAFTLAFTLALAAVVEAVRSGGLARAALAGVAVGLAWNTKYHGWLAAAIVAPAALPWLLRGREPGRLRRAVTTLAVVTLVAMACYLPWALHVERSLDGGYAALARYQSGMLRPGWLSNLARQARFQDLLDGPWTRASLPLALAVALAAAGRGGGARALAAGVGLAMAAAILGGPLAFAFLAVAGLPLLVRRERGLPGLAIATWLFVWLVLTPMYRPYARLVLPAAVAACLAAGCALQAIAERSRSDTRDGAVAALGLGALLALVWPARGLGDPWRATDGLRRTAAALAMELPAGERVYAVGEPALAAYLLEAGVDAVGHVGGKALPERLDGATTAAWIVTGRYARSTGAEGDLAERYANRLGTELRLPFEPGDQRLLDDDDPWQARAYRAQPDGRYELVARRVAPAVR